MSKNKKQIIIFISWIIAICWIGMIFYLSSQPVYKSNGLSKNLARIFIELVQRINPDVNLNLSRVNHLLRKSAHFFSYMILGILIMNVLRRMKVSKAKGIVLALLICILYAISDEFHQLFVPGRGGQLKDVFIDTAGSIVGISIYNTLSSFKKKV